MGKLKSILFVDILHMYMHMHMVFLLPWVFVKEYSNGNRILLPKSSSVAVVFLPRSYNVPLVTSQGTLKEIQDVIYIYMERERILTSNEK